jgi:hypothetical protein
VLDSTYYVKVINAYTVAFYHDSSLTIPVTINFADTFSDNTNLNVIPVGTSGNFTNYAYSTTSVGLLGYSYDIKWINNYTSNTTLIRWLSNGQPIKWINKV